MKIRLALLVGAFMALPAWATPVTYVTSLSGPNESPANTSSGTGNAQVTIDPDTHTMRVVVDFAGLSAANTASHIHVINGPGDTNTSDTLGPVATTTPTFTGFPPGTAGSYDSIFDMTAATSYRAGFITDSGGTTALAEFALFAGISSGRAYLNIHSSTFPGGEIRGFLAEAPPVPLPAAAWLLLSGLAGMFGISRRARRA